MITEEYLDLEGDVQPELYIIEGIGMDREDKPLPKLKKIKSKPALSEFELKVCAMSLTFNSNQIAAMLMKPKREIEAILNK